MLRFRFNITKQQQANARHLFMSPFNMELNRLIYRKILYDLIVTALFGEKWQACAQQHRVCNALDDSRYLNLYLQALECHWNAKDWSNLKSYSISYLRLKINHPVGALVVVTVPIQIPQITRLSHTHTNKTAYLHGRKCPQPQCKAQLHKSHMRTEFPLKAKSEILVNWCTMSDFWHRHPNQELQEGQSTGEAGHSSLETSLQLGSVISIPKSWHSLNTYYEVHT